MRFRTPIRHIAALVGISILGATTSSAVHAQAAERTLMRPTRALVGINGFYATPIGDFSERVNHGWGGTIHGTWLLHDSGVIGLRMDAGTMIYGRQRTRECLTMSCLVEADITTSNNLAFVGVGPELVVPAGPIRPYAAGQVGWTFLWTQSEVEGSDNDNRPFASSRNFSDNTFSYGGVGGVLIPFNRGGGNPVSLDLGVRYLRNGRVEYLRKGDIIINPGNPPTFNVQRSRADMVAYHIGITVGVR